MILHDMSPAAINAAIEANLVALWRSYSGLPGAEMCDRPDLFWVATDVAFPPFNGVVRTRLQPETIAPAIASTLEAFARHRVPMLWLVGADSQPADLGSRLIARGLTHVGDDPAMALDLNALSADLPQPAGFRIDMVNDLDTLRLWSSFTDQTMISEALFAWGQAAGHGPDRDVFLFLGRLDGRPVATSTLVLGGGVAGIYSVMTVPDAQRRGIGALLTARPLEEARSRGYRIATLQSSTMGLPLYRRLGFQEYGRVAIYLWRGDEPRSIGTAG